MYSEIITLIKKNEAIDQYGDLNVIETKRNIFGRLDRIYFTEALQAMAQGFERQARFRISDFLEYENEEELEYDGKRWKIANTQRIGRELEINCVGGVEHGRT